ncbi:hypothetical protein BV25DRAFT_641336 [Artomyces pyxidatus]|uniref:Uncharacterized protein n=1 Tax=Artomyces pyxidatus TaxID=48021 RepID=A0ACB8T1X8_9AGAM|nr:hypothetical protein BV25DRAFT_641336 [Artomyces pyxidatus]
MSSTRKRKERPQYRADTRPSHYLDQSAGPSSQPDAALFIVAHEADLVRGPQAAYAANSLEVTTVYDADGQSSKRIGDSLIKWERGGEQGEDIWVDRYDARLLLDALPNVGPSSPQTSRPNSPSGWSDLPSDTEDTFFFSREEAEDYHRDKRRRQIDQLREDRLRALQAEEDAADSASAADKWGGSDEEPDEPQMTVMRRTATHVLATPNSAHLEMRILANHGADPRFAFLRGRWARAWARVKAEARRSIAEQEAAKQKAKGIGGLMDYADSDEDSDAPNDEASDTRADVSHEAPDGAAIDTPASEGRNSGGSQEDAEQAAKEARRARAKQWAEARRAMKVDSNTQIEKEDNDMDP